jgi:tRNA nucleotidyltransferase/poly(A) polymerase
MKLFGGNYTAQTILLMDDFEILEEIFPFVKELKKVPPNSHHHLDLFHHVIETVRNIELLYQNSNQEVIEHLNQIDFGGFPRINHLKLAGFMHDLGQLKKTVDIDL